MKFIKLELPGKNPMIVRVDKIVSVAFQKQGNGAYKDSLFIVLDGWKTPYVYEGDDAKKYFDLLERHLEPTALD